MSESSVITVALFEDNVLICAGLTNLLNSLPDVEVVAVGATADPELLRKTTPQIVLLDLSLQDGDSLRLAERVRVEFPDARVILMDLLPAEDEIMEYVNAGVRGFSMKDATLDELAATIRAVANGEKVLPPEMTASLFSQIAEDAVTKGPDAVVDLVRMTPREREVINLIAEGMSNKEISKSLHIATHTVKSHVRNIMEKMTLHTRLQIAAYVHGQREA